MVIKCPKCHRDNPPDAAFCAHCAAPLPSFPGLTETAPTPLVRELVSGHTFAGRFEVVEELGHGGMGRVYKVFDTRAKEKIALKLLKPEVSSDDAAIERFENELRFARKVSHRNVCRMYDLGDEKGTRYITMEYVPGEDLKSMLRMMGPMSPGKTLWIARQVCEGLAEAHRLGVVHRDLKPQNIMIDREGNVRIMDFGIARSAKVKGLTGAGIVVGTPEYMSPEQMEGKEADGRSDIYSLGIILYEMVTGKLPFEGETFVCDRPEAEDGDPEIAEGAERTAPGRPQPAHPEVPGEGPGVPLSERRGHPGRPGQDRQGHADHGKSPAREKNDGLQDDHRQVQAEQAYPPGPGLDRPRCRRHRPASALHRQERSRHRSRETLLGRRLLREQDRR